MGPTKCGPIWGGQGTHPINACPCGACIWVPRRGTHYRSRFLFLFSGRTSTRLRLVPGSYNAPLRGAYGYPVGVPIISRDLFNTCARVREDPTRRVGAHVAILAKNIVIQAKISGSLFSVPLRDYFSLRAPAGPLMHPLRVHIILWPKLFFKNSSIYLLLTFWPELSR